MEKLMKIKKDVGPYIAPSNDEQISDFEGPFEAKTKARKTAQEAATAASSSSPVLHVAEPRTAALRENRQYCKKQLYLENENILKIEQFASILKLRKTHTGKANASVVANTLITYALEQLGDIDSVVQHIPAG
jgi:hypothetical protein